jgi:hypothetical protein
MSECVISLVKSLRRIPKANYYIYYVINIYTKKIQKTCEMHMFELFDLLRCDKNLVEFLQQHNVIRNNHLRCIAVHFE